MEYKIIEKNKFSTDDNYKVIDIENIINYDIDNIYLDDSDIKVINNYTFKDIYNDVNHPFVLEKDNIFNANNLYINPEFYLKNQEYVDNKLCDYFKNIKKETVDIRSIGLIKSNIIDAIVSNPNIKLVYLAKYSKNGYTLTVEDYNKFKNAGIRVDSKYVCEELKENFDDIIKCNSERNLISHFKYRDLVEKRTINLSDKLSLEEMNNLKYINPDTMLVFHINDYEHIMDVNKKLKELGKSNNIKINIEDKIKFNDFIFTNNINESNLYIETPDLESVSLESYLKFEKLLYQMIKNTNNLSPFEKYIYAYNITKQFKLYKENENKKEDSRKLYSLLVNEYMVCVGYSRLFGDLLNKMGIENMYLTTSVDTSYDGVNLEETEIKDSISVKKDGHARRYVNIVDPKYDIDGFYVSDPTWDNDLEHDYYNHLAMTDNETTYSSRYIWINHMDIFNVKNMNEYIEKMKRLKNKSDFNNFLYELNRIISVIKEIDNNFYNKLIIKYNYINGYLTVYPDNITDLIYDLGEYIVSKVNNSIKGDILFEAIKNVYKNSYGYEEDKLSEILEKVRLENSERQKKYFPTRYKVNQDGTKEEIESINNFDNVRKL